MSVGITLGGYDVDSRETALIDVNFQSNGQPVKFGEGETVSCGGTELKPYIGSFETAFSRAAIEGRTMACLYAYGQQSAPFSFQVPLGLAILSPHDREAVAASQLTVVSYRSAPAKLPFVVALAPNAKVWARPEATTSTRATLDTSALRGVGSISMTQQNISLEIQGQGFQSTSGNFQSMTMVAVTWI